MRQFEKYVNRSEYKDYRDFAENFKIVIPDCFNYAYDVLDDLAEKTPDAAALLWVAEDGINSREISFKEMSGLSMKAANMFSGLGIAKGDRVMLVLKRHIEFWVCMMALCRIGAVAIPATHLLQAKDIKYRCEKAHIKMIVAAADSQVPGETDACISECTSVEKLMVVNGSRNGWMSFADEIEKYTAVFPRPEGVLATKNDDIMLLYFTSGTSGMPKMVAHDFVYPLAHIVTAVYWHNAVPGGRHLTVADTGWAKAVWGKLYGQWLAETCIFVYEFGKFNPAKMLEIIEKYKVTTFCAPPTVYRYFIKENLEKYDLSSVKWASIAGEALNPEVFEQLERATKIQLHEIFGQTELTVIVGNFLWMTPKPGSMGKPNPVYNIDIINENGESCAVGEIGEIVLDTKNGRPCGMFLGYVDDDEMTNNVWHDDYYHTGDEAWKDEDGYYWYVGRCDDLIKASGYRISPFEVESVLMEHPAVLETAVTGTPHPERGQVVKATIVLANGYSPSEELVHEIQDFVKHKTAPYKYPRIVDFVSELPKTISGKIRRVEIRHNDNNKMEKNQ